MNRCYHLRAAAIGLLAVALAGCGDGQLCAKVGAVTTAPVGDRNTSPARQLARGLVDFDPGPIVQFERSCARCHGPQGSFYGQEFADLEPQRLRQIVEKMMRGPAGLEPGAVQIDAMVGYQQALHQNVPFLVINNAASFACGHDPVLRGEVTPDTLVQCRAAGRVIPVQVEDPAWTLAGAPRPPFVLTAVADHRQVSIDFPSQQWSTGRNAPR